MKNIIPIMLAIALTNMSCGKSKKEEPVTIEQENQNIDQPQANEPENPKKEVGVITTEFGDLIVEFLRIQLLNTLKASSYMQKMGSMMVPFFIVLFQGS